MLHDLADGSAAADRFVLRIGTPRVSAEGAVTEVVLEPVAPNPSSGSARVAFALPEAGSVRLTVVDVRGREVALLAEGLWAAGRHETRLGAAAHGYPITYEAGGRQFIAVPAALGGSFRFLTAQVTPEIYQPDNGNALYVFALPE